MELMNVEIMTYAIIGMPSSPTDLGDTIGQRLGGPKGQFNLNGHNLHDAGSFFNRVRIDLAESHASNLAILH